jgi:hypothetical protein
VATTLPHAANACRVVSLAWKLLLISPSNNELGLYRLVPVRKLPNLYGHGMQIGPNTKASVRMPRRPADFQEHYRRVSVATHQEVTGTRPHFPFTVPEIPTRHEFTDRNLLQRTNAGQWHPGAGGAHRPAG